MGRTACIVKAALRAMLSVPVVMMPMGLFRMTWDGTVLPFLPFPLKQRTPKGKVILMASNHKTGTSLSEKFIETLTTAAIKYDPESKIERLRLPLSAHIPANEFDLTFAQDMHCQSLPAYPYPYCLVHLVRDPINVVVSAYTYHLRVGDEHSVCGNRLCEEWLYQPIENCPWIAGDNVSLYDKLRMARQQSDLQGLACQYDVAKWTVQHMLQCFTEAKQKKHDVLQIDLDSVPGQIDQVLTRIHETCGLEEVVPLGHWLAESSSLRPDPNHSHVNNDKSREKILRQMVAELDFDFGVNLTELYAFLNHTSKPEAREGSE